MKKRGIFIFFGVTMLFRVFNGTYRKALCLSRYGTIFLGMTGLRWLVREPKNGQTHLLC